MLRSLTVSSLALCAALAWASSAFAQFPGTYGEDFMHLRGYGVSGSLYGLGHVPVPPYFALHPPVYYSMPVPRTYGYSPFAYPGHTPTPEISLPEPEMIMNPHVKPEELKKPEQPAQKTSTRVTASPKWIANPYVSSAAIIPVASARE